MNQNTDFDLQDFMPYLLNQAAEHTRRGFETYYKSKYGMLRTEWRVIFHLGRCGKMTAKDICDRARMHKTKVSRAVQSLEEKHYLHRKPLANDRRHEVLELTNDGEIIFNDLHIEAQEFDKTLMAKFTEDEQVQIRQLLIKISDL